MNAGRIKTSKWGLWVGAALAWGPATGLCGVLEFVGQPTEIIKNVAIYPEAKLRLPGMLHSTPLYLTGAGIREVRVILLNLDVYVAANYVDSPAGIPAAEPVDAIRRSKTKALLLTFLRHASPGRIQDAFSEALQANGVDLKDPILQQVFSKLTFSMNAGGKLLIVGFHKETGRDGVFFEVGDHTFTIDGPDLATTFWKMWFGVPCDTRMGELKEKLIGKKEAHP